MVFVFNLVLAVGLVCDSTYIHGWRWVGWSTTSSDANRLTAYVGVGVGSAYSERVL